MKKAAYVVALAILAGCVSLEPDWPTSPGPLEITILDVDVHDIYNVTWTFRFQNNGTVNLSGFDIDFVAGITGENQTQPAGILEGYAPSEFLKGDLLQPGAWKDATSKVWYGDANMTPGKLYWPTFRVTYYRGNDGDNGSVPRDSKDKYDLSWYFGCYTQTGEKWQNIPGRHGCLEDDRSWHSFPEDWEKDVR